MDRNIAVPILFVLGFVAILASILVPAMDDHGTQVYQATQGDTLEFVYIEDSALGLLPISSDDGLSIRQERVALGAEGENDEHAYRVFLNLLKPGLHTVQVGEGPKSGLFQVEVFVKLKATPSGGTDSKANLYWISPELGIVESAGEDSEADMFGDDEGLWLTPKEKKELKHHNVPNMPS